MTYQHPVIVCHSAFPTVASTAAQSSPVCPLSPGPVLRRYSVHIWQMEETRWNMELGAVAIPR